MWTTDTFVGFDRFALLFASLSNKCYSCSNKHVFFAPEWGKKKRSRKASPSDKKSSRYPQCWKVAGPFDQARSQAMNCLS